MIYDELQVLINDIYKTENVDITVKRLLFDQTRVWYNHDVTNKNRTLVSTIQTPPNSMGEIENSDKPWHLGKINCQECQI